MKKISLLEWAVFIAFSGILIAGSWFKFLPTTMIEVFGFITGAATVWLQVKENVWNWPLSIVSALFYVILFFNARLFADMGLQFVYVALGFLGIYMWLKGGKGKEMLRVSSIPKKEIIIYTVVGIVLTIGMTHYLRSINDSAPFLDALTTVLSLIAQYMLVRKYIENWYLWIVADVIYVYLYIDKDLYLTAVLYFIFLLMCVAGLRVWKKSHRTSPEIISPHP